MGAGVAERSTKVRWQVGYKLLAAWFITVPIHALDAILMLMPLQRRL
jgi:phosphate/sulfate permease